MNILNNIGKIFHKTFGKIHPTLNTIMLLFIVALLIKNGISLIPVSILSIIFWLIILGIHALFEAAETISKEIRKIKIENKRIIMENSMKDQNGS